MKAMNRIATKIAGVALATVMAFGGAAVFAAENGEQVFNDNLYVKAEREYIWETFDYTGETMMFTVPEDGLYTVSCSCEDGEDFYKSVVIYSSSGRIPFSNSGYWESNSIPGVDLHTGVWYTIEVNANDFMGITTALDGIARINVSLTLTEKFEEEEIPEIEEEPEEIIEIEEEPAEIVTIEEAEAEPLESIAPAAPALTIAQIRELAVRNFVGHLYTDGLRRRATESEITEWADKLMCGSITATDAASQILTSSELNEHNFDNEQIAAILSDVFNAESQSDILAKLNDGASVASVIEQLAGTDNWASKCAFYGVNV